MTSVAEIILPEQTPNLKLIPPHVLNANLMNRFKVQIKSLTSGPLVYTENEDNEDLLPSQGTKIHDGKLHDLYLTGERFVVLIGC